MQQRLFITWTFDKGRMQQLFFITWTFDKGKMQQPTQCRVHPDKEDGEFTTAENLSSPLFLSYIFRAQGEREEGGNKSSGSRENNHEHRD